MKLKMARTISEVTQVQLQTLTKGRVWQTRISQAEAGTLDLQPDEKAAIEKALGTPVDWEPPKRFRRTNKGEQL